MREQFAKTFMTKLVGEIPDDALKVVYQFLISDKKYPVGSFDGQFLPLFHISIEASLCK